MTGHGVPDELVSGAIDNAREFFELPQAEKQQIAISPGWNVSGYQAPGLNVTQGAQDWHEALDLFMEVGESHTEMSPQVPNRGRNQWPSKALPSLEVFFNEYTSHMLQLGQQIMSGIALGKPENSSSPSSMFCIVLFVPMSVSVLRRPVRIIHDAVATYCQWCWL